MVKIPGMNDGVCAAATATAFFILCPVRGLRTTVFVVRRTVHTERSGQSNFVFHNETEWHNTMAKYVIKRVAMGIFSVFIVATLTFFIMNMVPGGPFVAEKSISAAAQQALNEKYGLDKPLGVQYVNYMSRSEEHTSELQSPR